LYARAESLFRSRGDARNELYAKIGRLRSEAETMSFVDLSRLLGEQLQTPIMVNDAELRLWCLAAKGYTDLEIDYQAEKRDWLEAQQIAKSLGENRWVTRASGELGIIAFLEGHTGQGAKLLGTALVSTMANGDTGGQIRFLEMLGNGMVEVNRHGEALMFFERAIKLAEADKDSGLPFMAYEGKAQALVAEVFELRREFEWRGLGFISHSALQVREKYAAMDAERLFQVPGVRVADPKACQCGEVLKGVIKPWECKVFGTACTPERPLGTCMVSSEGACAAYYAYGRHLARDKMPV